MQILLSIGLVETIASAFPSAEGLRDKGARVIYGDYFTPQGTGGYQYPTNVGHLRKYLIIKKVRVVLLFYQCGLVISNPYKAPQ